jgi:iron complex outermembrane receptor protein
MKRESAVLDVPFSVAAPAEQTLRDRGVQDIEGVAANVAGFTVQNLGPGQSQVAMRGVSAGQIVRDQPGVKEQVGTFLDESVISLSLFTPDLDLFDTNRIEVLRGPQGTLFGAGSLAGTVRYITNQPELGVTSSVVELGASGVDGGGFGGNAKLAFNLPMGEKAALRVASYFSRLPGYMEALQPDLSVKEDVNDGFRTGVRAAVKLTPNDRFSITPRLVYQRVESNGWNRIDEFNILANPFTTTRPAITLGDRRQFTQLEEEFSDDFLLGDVNLNYSFGDLSLTSITSYIYRDVLVVRDATALTASITGGSIGLPEPVFTLDAPLLDDTRAHTWTQELRLSRATGRLPWVAGLFYSRQNREYGQDLPVRGFEDLTGIPTRGLRAPKDTLFFSDLDYTLDQFSLFGEGTLSLNDRFNLTAGLRFYYFNEDKDQIFDAIFANDDTGTALVSQPGSTDATGLAPRLILTYRLPQGSNLNGQLSRGFRLGGVNVHAPGPHHVRWPRNVGRREGLEL